MNALVYKDEAGDLVRLAGVMGVVLTGGEIRAGDTIEALMPEGECTALEPV